MANRIGQSIIAAAAIAAAGVGGAVVAPSDPQGGWQMLEPSSIEVSTDGSRTRILTRACKVTRSYDGPNPCARVNAPGVVGVDIDEHMQAGTTCYEAVRTWAGADAGSRILLAARPAGLRVDTSTGSAFVQTDPPACVDTLKSEANGRMVGRLNP